MVKERTTRKPQRTDDERRRWLYNLRRWLQRLGFQASGPHHGSSSQALLAWVGAVPPAARAAAGLIATIDTPDIEVDTLEVNDLLNSSGKWTTVFAGIEVDVDTEEGLALILGDQG